MTRPDGRSGNQPCVDPVGLEGLALLSPRRNRRRSCGPRLGLDRVASATAAGIGTAPAPRLQLEARGEIRRPRGRPPRRAAAIGRRGCRRRRMRSQAVELAEALVHGQQSASALAGFERVRALIRGVGRLASSSTRSSERSVSDRGARRESTRTSRATRRDDRIRRCAGRRCAPSSAPHLEGTRVGSKAVRSSGPPAAPGTAPMEWAALLQSRAPTNPERSSAPSVRRSLSTGHVSAAIRVRLTQAASCKLSSP